VIFDHKTLERRWIDGIKRALCPQDLKSHDGYRLVGSSGRAQKQVKSDEFTTVRRVVPSQCEGYPGYHTQFQCSPQEAKALKRTGLFSKLGPGRYIA